MIVQTHDSSDVAPQMARYVGHEEVGAVADPELGVLPALHRAGCIGVVPVDIQRVLVRVAAFALLRGDAAGFWVVLDLTDADVSTEKKWSVTDLETISHIVFAHPKDRSTQRDLT